MEDPTILERTAGGLPATIAATALAAAVGGVVAALPSVLLGSLASARQAERIRRTFAHIEARLGDVERFQQQATDAQFAFIREAVEGILRAPDEAKMRLLAEAIVHCATEFDGDAHAAEVAARALNGMTVEEFRFMFFNADHGVLFSRNAEPSYVNVDRMSHEGECATGLINLGLLARNASEGLAGDNGSYVWTPLARRVLKLVGAEFAVPANAPAPSPGHR